MNRNSWCKTVVSLVLGLCFLSANSPAQITLDGDFSDWSGAFHLGTDPADDVAASDTVDWLSLWGCLQGEFLYLSYQTDGAIDFTGNAWRYAILLDTDNDATTGFRGMDGSFGVGADYMVEGGILFLYTGQGTDWSWTMVGVLNYMIAGNRLEMRIAINDLNITRECRLRIMLLGNNASTADYAADDRVGFLFYGFTAWLLPNGYPQGIAYNGQDFWLVDSGNETLYRLDDADFSILNGYDLSALSSPVGVDWDGISLWVTDNSADIYEVNPTNGILTGAYRHGWEMNRGTAFATNGDHWVATSGGAKLYRFEAAGGTLDRYFSTHYAAPWGLTWYDSALWSVGLDENTLCKIDPDDGTHLLETAIPLEAPRGIVYANGSFWITDAASGRVYPFAPPPEAPTGLVATDGTRSNGVEITWASVAGAQEYRVSCSQTPYSPKTVISGWQTALSYTDTDAVPGETNYYWVQARWDRQGLVGAFNTGAESGWCAFDGQCVLETTIIPPAAIYDGAQWRVDGGEWMESGDVLVGASVGTHVISFRSIDDWDTPADRTISLSVGRTEIAGVYSNGQQDISAWFAPGWDPWGLSTDGSSLWCVDRNAHTLYAMNAVDGTVQQIVEHPCEDVRGLTWDGTNFWMADDDRLYREAVTGGDVLTTMDGPRGWQQGLAWDGNHLWVNTEASWNIFHLDPALGPDDSQYIPRNGNWAVRGLTMHNGYLWSIDAVECRLHKINPVDGTVVASYNLPFGYPRGLTWLDGKFWVLDALDGSIYAFEITTGLVIDGNFGDWDDVALLGMDPPGDISAGDVVDWLHLWAAEQDNTLFLSWQTVGDIDFDNHAWRYGVCLDTDADDQTGFHGLGGSLNMGAEYMIEGATLFEYTGSGENWSWSVVSVLPYALLGDRVEMSISKSLLNLGPDDEIRFQLVGNNPNTVDYAPDTTAGFTFPGEDPVPEEVLDFERYLVYYGAWDANIVSRVTKYDLIVLDVNNGPALDAQPAIIDDIQAGLDGVAGTEDDVRVLGYVSIGEDGRTYNHAAADTGDGRGPCYYDRNTGEVVYEYKGVASYYMDEWDVEGPLGHGPLEHDGLPDRNGEWGACYVNAGDTNWQDYIIGQDRTSWPYGFDTVANVIGCDGFFLDTPEVASPWERFGWTSKGVHDLIARLDATFPDKLLLLNRGLFFFVPHNREQYEWCPREYLDIVLFESYYMDSAYEDGHDYHLSPWFNMNRYYSSPKLNAELGRSDSYCPIVNIDYCRDPDTFPVLHGDVYSNTLQNSIGVQGRVELVTDRMITSLDNPVLDYPPELDRDAPTWDNTTSGFESFDQDALNYESAGMEDASPRAPRIGVQKAIPGDGQVVLRWDATLDQTRRIKYNIYYWTAPFTDFDAVVCLPDVETAVGGDYAERSYLSVDDGCPYEYTVTGLANDTPYYFAVRAEDSTWGISDPETGRPGPGGGIEDDNRALLPCAPRAQSFPISIDGAFSDWVDVPAYTEEATDAAGGVVEWTTCKINDNEDTLYLYAKCAQPVNAGEWNRYVIYLSTDQKSYTGYTPKIGADYMIMGGRLYQYIGSGKDWNWAYLGFAVYSFSGSEIEIALDKDVIELLAVDGGVNVLLYGDNAVGNVDLMPDAGACGYSYSCTQSPVDTNPPVFNIHSFTAVDAQVDGLVKVEWEVATDVNGPVRYEVYDTNGTLLAVSEKNRVFIKDLDNGVSYTLYVRVIDNQDNYIDSDTMAVIPTLNTVPPAWETTVGIQLAEAKDSLAMLYWNKANDASHPPADYNVYYSTSPIVFDGSETKRSSVLFRESEKDGYDWMFILPGLDNGVTYYVAVRAQDRIGNEDTNTQQVTVTPQAPTHITEDTMDGVFSDWTVDETVVFCGNDTVGDGTGGEPGAEFLRAWMDDDEDWLFVRWQLNGAADTASFKYMLYLDTDRDVSTGFLTDWDTVGAEFMSMNGRLYRFTGTNGTADWSWELLEDNIHFSPGVMDTDSIEMALPRDTLGLTGLDQDVGVWFYISDEVVLTVDECFPDYGRGGYVYPFSQMTGAIRLDGMFGDWETAQDRLMRLDPTDDGYTQAGVPAPGALHDYADIEQVDIVSDSNRLYLCLGVQGGIDFAEAEYSVYLDTDQDAASGYQASYGAVGAEYRFWNGNLYAYTGNGVSWDWLAVPGAFGVVGTEDNSRMELAIDRTAIHWTNSNPLAVFLIASDKNNTPTNWQDNIDDYLPELGQQCVYPPIGGDIRIDGLFNDWALGSNVCLLGTDPVGDGFDNNGQPVTNGLGTMADIRNVWATDDADYLYIRLETEGDIDTLLAGYSFYLDLDRSSLSGFKANWSTVGAEYRIHNGVLYSYIGDGTSWEWTDLGAVPTAVGQTNASQMELALERDAIGWTAGQGSMAVFTTVTDVQSPTNWLDDISDYLPELQQGGVSYPDSAPCDLSVASMSYVQTETTPYPVYRFDVVVTNNALSAAGAFEVNIWLDGTALTPAAVSGLGASSSTTASVYWTHSSGGWPVWAGAKADSGNHIIETDETNNENGIAM